MLPSLQLDAFSLLDASLPSSALTLIFSNEPWPVLHSVWRAVSRLFTGRHELNVNINAKDTTWPDDFTTQGWCCAPLGTRESAAEYGDGAAG